MQHLVKFGSATLAFAIGLASVARAEEGDDTATAVQETPVAAVSGEESDEVIVIHAEPQDAAHRAPGFRTHVELSDYQGETRSLGDVLSDSVGVQVRSLGGLGGFASVSIRGASPSHTAVFVDGVPLSRLGMASQDLGAFDVNSFSSMDIYRGSVPMELGGAAMGGALDLRTFGEAPPASLGQLSIGAGSFGSRHMRGRVHDHLGNLRYLLSLGYGAARGDYDYFNDNGTLLVAEDDRFEARRNNGYEQLQGTARGQYQWSHNALELGSRTIIKNQGIPGAASIQSDATTLETRRQLLDGHIDFRPADETRARLTSYVLFNQQEYRDIEGEIGLGNQHNRYRTMSSGLTGRVQQTLSESHVVSVAAEVGGELFRSSNLLDMSLPSPRTMRWNGGAAISDEIRLGDAFLLSPTLRVDHQYTDPGTSWSPIIASPDELQPRTEYLFSPRLSARYFAGPIIFKSNIGRYFRAPTANELFGDRGFMVGNPLLRSETGVMGDAGFIWAPETSVSGLDRVQVQGALFASRNRSTIVLLPASGQVAIAQNLGNALLFGSESSLTLRVWKRLSLTANHTFVDSRQSETFASYEGKSLPMRPRHEFYGRAASAHRLWNQRFSLWADLSFTSGNFIDAANRSEVPSRTFLGAGLKAPLGAHFLLGLEVKNIGNERIESIPLDPPPRQDLAQVPRAVSDFFGYPLPGRAFYLNLDSTF